MRILTYLALMACAVLSGLCGMVYWNPLAAYISGCLAVCAGVALGREKS